jgi:hypothetical protein
MKNTTKIRKQKIREEITDISPWDLSGSPEDICKILRETQDAYLKKYNNEDILEVGWTWETSSYGDGEGHFTLIMTRLENDKEYNARVKKLMKIKEGEKAAKQQEKDNEYTEYLRLKKKFEANPYRTNDWSQP